LPRATAPVIASGAAIHSIHRRYFWPELFSRAVAQADTIRCPSNGHPPPAIAEADEKIIHAELARRDAGSVFEAATANLATGEQLVTLEAWLEFGKDGKLAKVIHGGGTTRDKFMMLGILREADLP
jgi:hypothetical protein